MNLSDPNGRDALVPDGEANHNASPPPWCPPADHVPVPLCVIARGRLAHFNPAFTRLFGESDGGLWQAGTAELGLGAIAALQDTPDHEWPTQPLPIEARAQAGDSIRLVVYVSRTEHEGGPALLATLLGAAPRVSTERPRGEWEERNALALRATSNVVWDWDPSTGRIVWGEVAYSAFGYAPEEVGESYDWWFERVHPDDTRHVISSLETVLRREGQLWTTEYRFRRGDGSYAVVLSRGYVMRRDDGTPARVVGAMTDLTGHRQLEERFYQAQRMEAIGRLASGVAHDFNNVLMVIQGTTDLLLTDAVISEAVRQDLMEIRRAAERATALTRQLLAFGRRQVLRPEVVDLNATIREMHGMLQRIVGEDVELAVHLGRDLSPVRVDRRQLEQVILNLAANARDAMPQGGRVTIETSDAELRSKEVENYAYPVIPGAYVRLSVEDNGDGMDADTLAQIFEPFFTTKRSGKGTGLGLATVYGFVKQSGGYIWARSELHGGTRFDIYLPRSEKKLAARPPERYRPTLPSGSGTILLVEDEGAVRAVTSRILSRAGYTVLEARNGAEAWDRFNEDPQRIQLLLTDVVMPEMGGRELAGRIVAVRPDVHVIYMSGQTDDRILRQGIGRRTVNFVQKPFRPEALLQKIGSLLRSEEV
jgi:two-component system, cell cycle sensor histidine kinase and response regulator CckA